MTSRAATFPGVPAYNGRGFALGEHRRAIAGTFLLGASSVIAIVAVGSAATLTAAWLIAGTFGRNADLRASAPVALQAGLPRPLTRLTDGETFAGRFAALSAPVIEATREAALAPAAAPPVAIAPPAVPLPRKRVAERIERVPLPVPRPLQRAPVVAASVDRFTPTVVFAQAPARAEIVRVAAKPAEPEPEVTGSIARRDPIPMPAAPAPAKPMAPSPALPAPIAPAVADRRAGPQLAYADPKSLLTPESHTAIYDIAAHAVYLPSGRRLEAHSGLGRFLDDPRFITQKARGPTPPNVYRLTLREQLFHGVRAIRLNPEDEHKMYGRDGILAHTYMLGPSGQSFGCVSFKNYPEFLNAFLRGEIDRLVVVPHLETPPFSARA
jgi:type VI secretion system (T6SS) effector TldE1-like protein